MGAVPGRQGPSRWAEETTDAWGEARHEDSARASLPRRLTPEKDTVTGKGTRYTGPNYPGAWGETRYADPAANVSLSRRLTPEEHAAQHRPGGELFPAPLTMAREPPDSPLLAEWVQANRPRAGARAALSPPTHGDTAAGKGTGHPEPANPGYNNSGRLQAAALGPSSTPARGSTEEWAPTSSPGDAGVRRGHGWWGGSNHGRRVASQGRAAGAGAGAGQEVGEYGMIMRAQADYHKIKRAVTSALRYDFNGQFTSLGTLAGAIRVPCTPARLETFFKTECPHMGEYRFIFQEAADSFLVCAIPSKKSGRRHSNLAPVRGA